MLDRPNARLITVTLALTVLLSLASIVVLTLADKAVPDTLSDVLKTSLGAALALATVRAANPTPVTATTTGGDITVTPLEPVDEPKETAVILGDKP